MPNLLSINNYYYARGGAETIFLEHNRLLAAEGWSVAPFAMRHPKNLPSEWSEYFIEELELGSDYSFLEKAVRLPKVIYSLEARRRLSSLLAAFQPQVCHAHNIYHHLSPSILGLLKSRHIPTVMTLHDLKVACPAYSMLTHDGVCERCRGGKLSNVIRHRCIKGSVVMSSVIYLEATLHRWLDTYRQCVSKFVVPSRFYLEKLVSWGFDRAQFEYIPNFIDTGNFRPGYEPGRHVVFVGRLSPEKGIATLISACHDARVPLKIAGTGPQEAQLQTLANSLGAEVEFLGYVSGSRLHDTIRSARVAAVPSESYENAPLGVLEAYALGKPVIGARIGGIPELIREGETGCIVPSGDRQALATTIRAFADMPDDAVQEIGIQGRQWVERDFTSKQYLERIRVLYDSVSRLSSEAATAI